MFLKFTTQNQKLKQLFGYILVLVVLVNPLVDGIVFVSFKANQAQIAATQCENRDRPELACKGKCVLMKKLEKQARDEEKEFPQSETYKLILFASIVQKQQVIQSYTEQLNYCFIAPLFNDPFLGKLTPPPEFLIG